MNCPSCGSNDFKVLDSRPTDSKTIRRRRECQSCQKRFTTYEIIEAVPLSVVKKNGVLEIFDPNKIIAGVRRACYKRPVTDEQIQDIVSDIENEHANNLKENITTEEIGNMVMDKLREIDEVSYVRFASVYREFKDVETFMNALRGLRGKKPKKK